MQSQNQKGQLRWHLYVIFLYYASYADRNNYKLLKSQNYRRFLIDSQTVTDHTAFPPFDIAFRKIHTTAITQQQFQQLIPNIAQLAFPQKKRKEAFESYVSLNLQKLYHEILYKSDFGADVLLIENVKIEAKSLQLLESVPLRKAYTKYIGNTSMHQKSPEQTFQQLHIFLSEFEISPKLIYKAMTYLMFFYLLKIKDNQSKYQVEDFKKLLIYIAEIYWKRIEGQDADQQQKVVLIMQQMELSIGFKKMVDKTLKESAVMVSFFKKNTSRRLNTEEAKMKASLERQNINDSIERQVPKTAKHQHQHQRCTSFFSAKRNQRKQNLGAVRDLLQHAENGVNIKELKSIFEQLCSQGEVANTKTLKSIKLRRYFQGINILLPISQSWLDLKIAELCRSSPSGKVEFPLFVQLLSLASKELSITFQSLYEYLIDNSHHNPLVPSSYSTKETKDGPIKLKQVQDSRPTLTIFYQIEKQLQRIFLHYSSGKRQMKFDQLTHLLYDFDVFPAFITKSKLYKHFQKFGHSRNQLRGLVGEISLNLDEFMEVLHCVSSEIGENLTSEEQVLFMLERMQDSAGHRTILGGQGTNLIGDLRSRYSAIYLNALKKNNDQKVGFQELIEDYHP